MNILYNIFIEFVDKIFLPILSIFSKKISRFIVVRKDLLQEIISDFLNTTTIRDYINNIIKTVI